MEQQSNNTGASTVNYTRISCCQLFNNLTGSIKLGFSTAQFGRSYATISLASVFSEVRGRNPKKGEQTYDYDNAIYLSLSSEDLTVVRTALVALRENKIADIEMRFRGADIRLTKAELIGEKEFKDGIMLYALSKAKDKDADAYTHSFFFAGSAISGYLSSDEDAQPVDIPINPSFDSFCNFIEVLSKTVVSPIDYVQHRSGGFGSGGGGRSSYTPRTATAPSRRGTKPEAAANWVKTTEPSSENTSAPDDPYADDLPF